MPGTPGLACCAACGGFIVDPAAACIHCDVPPAPRRRLARFLLTAILGAAASVTLMACYGMTYECDRVGPNGLCNGVCYADTDCGDGYYCDDSTATCEWGGYCYNVGECPTGYECDLIRTTCVPSDGCDSNAECPGGTRCDPDSRMCVPEPPCGIDGLCGEGLVCDPSYLVCVACADDACGSCLGEVLCGSNPPECPDGTRPAIANLCYNGGCIAEATCVAEECLLLDEAACTASATCDPSYVGINCTNPDGSPCTGGTGCTCESYEYDRCVPAPMDPP